MSPPLCERGDIISILLQLLFVYMISDIISITMITVCAYVIMSNIISFTVGFYHVYVYNIWQPGFQFNVYENIF